MQHVVPRLPKHVQDLIYELGHGQKHVETTMHHVAKVDAKLADFDSFACEADLMLHQLRDLESGFSRHRMELARGSVRVNPQKVRQSQQIRLV